MATIQPTIANSIPNLTNLVLTTNKIAELADLDALAQLPRLTHLVLAENPVTKKEVGCSLASCALQKLILELQHYRYWVLWKLPSVRFLDYQKVKEAERERGRELFGSEEEPTALATKVGVTDDISFD